MKLTTYLLASAMFIGAGFAFGKEPQGLSGLYLCCGGIIVILWRATKVRV